MHTQSLRGFHTLCIILEILWFLLWRPATSTLSTLCALVCQQNNGRVQRERTALCFLDYYISNPRRWCSEKRSKSSSHPRCALLAFVHRGETHSGRESFWPKKLLTARAAATLLGLARAEVFIIILHCYLWRNPHTNKKKQSTDFKDSGSQEDHSHAYTRGEFSSLFFFIMRHILCARHHRFSVWCPSAGGAERFFSGT